MTQKHPVGVCPVCGETTHRMDAIGEQCSERPGGKRCLGIFVGAVSDSVWIRCPECHGEGRLSGVSCRECRHNGWIYSAGPRAH